LYISPWVQYWIALPLPWHGALSSAASSTLSYSHAFLGLPIKVIHRDKYWNQLHMYSLFSNTS
jgi:hypothetical protein